MKNETRVKSSSPELSIVLTNKPATGCQPDPKDVAVAAYYAWERDGKPEGCGEKYWIEAEARLRTNGGAAQPARKNGHTRAAA